MMKRYLTFLLPLALVPATGAGQRFFDDFDGEDLGGHWEFGNPKGGMIYSVHDSLLEVHALIGFFPSEWITARLPRYNDFDMEARVGWTDGPARESLVVAVGGGYPNDTAVAMVYFSRSTDGGKRRNDVGARFRDGRQVEVAAPSSGFHTFRLRRSAGLFSAYFNQELILQGTGSAMPADTIVLGFGGPDSIPVELFVDRVSVVPEPTTASVLAMGFAALALRWRRAN